MKLEDVDELVFTLGVHRRHCKPNTLEIFNRDFMNHRREIKIVLSIVFVPSLFDNTLDVSVRNWNPKFRVIRITVVIVVAIVYYSKERFCVLRNYQTTVFPNSCLKVF